MMGQLIRKTFVAKSLGDPDLESKTIELSVSTNRKDRHGEVILHEAWEGGLDDFMNQNGPLLSQHNYWGSLRNHIGKTESIRIDKDLGLVPKFKYFIGDGAPENEEVSWAWYLVTQKSGAFSVGFMDLEYKLGDGKNEPFVTYTKASLLEISQVLVGANPDAVQNALRKGVITREYSEYLLQDTGSRSIVVPEEFEEIKKSLSDLSEATNSIQSDIVSLTEKLFVNAGTERTRKVKGREKEIRPFVRINLK